MKMKNDCQVDYIKEAFDKLYNCVMPFIDLTQFADDANTAFKELDKKVHSEIYILKKRLAESDRAVDAGLTRSEVLQERISDLESENNAKQHVIESFVAKVNDLEKKIRHLEIENTNLRVTPDDANAIEVLKRENRVLRCDNKKLAAACEDNKRLREVIDTLEKEINSLKKKIHELEQETADDAIRIKSLERANSVLRGDNEILWSRLEEADIPEHHKRPWHGDANAMTGARTCCESLVKIIEFQSKKIEELEEELNEERDRAESLMLAHSDAVSDNKRLKEAYDIQETTIKRLKLLLGKEHKETETPAKFEILDHKFEFGDEVFVPWSDEPYMYFNSGIMYNPRTERLVYVGKTQHLKWFGERFEIK